jgi:SAM-dependent methyltransferase
MNSNESHEVKLNLGCGGRPLPGYINIDLDSIEDLKARYPQTEFPFGLVIHQYDILDLPFENNTVDLVKADSLIEHLSFSEEKQFFYEVKRVLKPGGTFDFSAPDFDETMNLWAKATDEWKEFFRSDDEAIRQEHWFGQYSYSTANKWGYLTASIFGAENSPGQFHKNCYTEPKIRAILEYLDFEVVEISRYMWKGDRNLMISATAKKKGS